MTISALNGGLEILSLAKHFYWLSPDPFSSKWVWYSRLDKNTLFVISCQIELNNNVSENKRALTVYSNNITCITCSGIRSYYKVCVN